MLIRRSVDRTERGAMAVFVAVAAVVLFGIGALAVDLGNAFSRIRDVQVQADFSALAGGNEIGVANEKDASDPAVIAVAEYLNQNQPQDDRGHACTRARTCVTSDDLVDGDDENGEVYFLPGDRMRVVSPRARVGFGLAAIFGTSSTQVQREATVQVRSGGGILPFFAVDGCDFGLQTISDPPPGGSNSINIAFMGGSETTNSATLGELPTPDVVNVNESPHPSITLSGTGLADTQEVGFFENNTTTVHRVGLAPDDDGDQIVSRTATSVVVKVPGEVLAASSSSWYVRVLVPSGGPGTNKWSRPLADEMAVLRVGSAVLECEAASNDGNFGTLKLPRLTPNTPSAWLPRNIAEGLEEPLSLATHDSAAYPWTCVDLGPSDDVIVSSTSPPSLEPETNCVDTDTGLPDNVATQGFITGSGGVPGRLDADTTPGCGSNASSPHSKWATGIPAPGPGNPEYKINDDLLTCFMMDEDKPLSDITVENYTDPPALNQDIYYSPRFFYMPVLGVDPSSGGSNRYSIVDFRAGFVTDQPLYATRSGRQTGSTTHNGIAVASGKISTIKVVFFNTNALPPPPDDAPDFAYMGSGPRLLKLVD